MACWRLLAFTALAMLGLVRAEQKPFNVEEAQDELIMIFEVGPGATDCFFQPIKDSKHVKFEMDYQVTDGGEMRIGFYVKGPNDQLIATEDGQRDGQHQVDVLKHGYGDYQFCFKNPDSGVRKVVFFEMFLLDKDGNFFQNFDDLGQNPLAQSIAGFERITTKVKNSLNEIERLQTQLRAAESRDRALMESNFERVNFWSLVHFVAIISTFAIQLYTIRSLFIEDSSVGRILRKGRLND